MSNRFSALLNNSKDLAIDTIKLLDPTGISSWGDAYQAIKHTTKDNPGTWVNAGVEVLGALPIVGKIGKVGKISKLVKKTEKLLSATGKSKKVIQTAKVPGKIVRQVFVLPIKVGQHTTNKTLNLIRKTPKVIDNTLVTRRINLGRNLVKSTAVAGDLDNIITGGSILKNIAYGIGTNSGGTANILVPILAYINKATRGPHYSGMAKANDRDRKAAGNLNPLRLVLFGDGGFKKYSKPLYLNGKLLENVYWGKLYPQDIIFANKTLKGTMLQANSENMYGTNNETPIIDSNHFRIKFNNTTARSSDEWDWNPYTISGKLMTSATKPTWLYPNAGIATFVEETPVKYTNKSNSILTTLLGK